MVSIGSSTSSSTSSKMVVNSDGTINLTRDQLLEMMGSSDSKKTSSSSRTSDENKLRSLSGNVSFNDDEDDEALQEALKEADAKLEQYKSQYEEYRKEVQKMQEEFNKLKTTMDELMAKATEPFTEDPSKCKEEYEARKAILCQVQGHQGTLSSLSANMTNMLTSANTTYEDMSTLAKNIAEVGGATSRQSSTSGGGLLGIIGSAVINAASATFFPQAKNDEQNDKQNTGKVIFDAVANAFVFGADKVASNLLGGKSSVQIPDKIADNTEQNTADLATYEGKRATAMTTLNELYRSAHQNYTQSTNVEEALPANPNLEEIEQLYKDKKIDEITKQTMIDNYNKNNKKTTETESDSQS